MSRSPAASLPGWIDWRSRGWLAVALAMMVASLRAESVLTFDTAGYVDGGGVLDVADAVGSAESGGVWTAVYSSPGVDLTTPAGTGVTGRSLRVTDASSASARALYLDTAGTLQTGQLFRVAFTFKVTGASAISGTTQLTIQFGRDSASGTTKNWLQFECNGPNARVYVDAGSNGNRTAVNIGTLTAGSWITIDITINPATKRYEKVLFNGVDASAAVKAVNNGLIPWKASSGDTVLPNERLWITVGTDDILTLDLDNVVLDNPDPGAMTFDTVEYVNGVTVIGVDDSTVPGDVWTRTAGVDADYTTPSGAGVAGDRALRIVDATASAAKIAAIDVAGAFDTTRNIAVSFDFRLSGANAINGVQQAGLRLGDHAGTGGVSKSWLQLDCAGSNLRLYVDATGEGDRTPVVVGTLASGVYQHVSVVINPVTKRVESVVVGGVDVTHRLLAINGGLLPWKSSAADAITPGQVLWLATGVADQVTLDLDNVRLKSTYEQWTSAASAEWLPYLKSGTDMKVQAGTALDLSSLYDRTEAGMNARGFAHVDQDGRLAFADGSSFRLFCAAEFLPESPMSAGTLTDQSIQDYVDQIARAGYNAYRPHFLDVYLMSGSTTDRVWNTTRFTRWQKLAAKLRARGIYLMMDATTSWNSFYAESPNAFFTEAAKLKRLKLKLLYDQDTRDHWRLAVTNLYTAQNTNVLLPYGGVAANTALRYDPQVVYTNMRNEPSLNFQLATDGLQNPALYDEPGLVAAWRAWLKDQQAYYATPQALSTAWGVSPAYTSFDAVPFPYTTNTGTTRYRDMRRFEVTLAQDAYAWMYQTIRQIGVKSLFSDFNNTGDLPNSLIRDTLALVDNHTYHDHGYDIASENLYWTHSNSSAFDDAIGMFRGMADTRQTGKPFTITEWGHVYWNPYRYEGGLYFPAYASFQDWSMIAQHAQPVILAPSYADHFLVGPDPIAKASEYMAAFLFARGDVATTQVRSEMVVDAINTRTEGDPGGGLDWWAKVLPFVTGFSMRVDWPESIYDDFAGSNLADVTTWNVSLGTKSAFWSTVLTSAASTATLQSGRLVLTATGSAYPSAALRSPAGLPLDFFTQPLQFRIAGLQLTTDSVAANQQVFRFGLTNGTGLAYSATSALIVEIFGHNLVKVGYKAGASAGAAYTYVATVNDLGTAPGTITGFSFIPLAVDLNAASTTGAAFDPTFDLVIHLAGTGTQPAYRHVTGRWNSVAGSTALTAAAWGATNANTVVMEAQKVDGVVNTKLVTVSLEDFTVGSRTIGPRAEQMTVHKQIPFPGTKPTFATVLGELRTAGLVSASNQTVAPVSESGANLYTGRYQTDTGQLYLEPGKRLFRLTTPRSEGVTMPVTLSNGSAAPTSAVLDRVQVTNLPAPGVPTPLGVMLTSLDPAGATTLADASRMLLVVSSDALNSTQRFSDYRRLGQIDSINGVKYAGRGGLPVLLRRAAVNLRIRTLNAAVMQVYPLNHNGVRRPAIPTTWEFVNGEPWLVANIDTGALGNSPLNASGFTDPAVFFEIATATPVTGPLQTWRVKNWGTPIASGLSADSADADGDGVPNLLEYALGTAPVSAASVARPIPVREGGAGSEYLTLAFARDRAATGVTLTVEGSSDLTAGSWTVIDPLLPVNQVSVQAGAPTVGFDTYTIRDVQPLSASPRRFMRLRVTASP